MSTFRVAKSIREKAIANTAGEAFTRPSEARVFRGAIQGAAVSTFLVYVATLHSGWVAGGLWILVGLRLWLWLFLGLASRVIREREARVACAPEHIQALLKSTTLLVSERVA